MYRRILQRLLEAFTTRLAITALLGWAVCSKLWLGTCAFFSYFFTVLYQWTFYACISWYPTGMCYVDMKNAIKRSTPQARNKLSHGLVFEKTFVLYYEKICTKTLVRPFPTFFCTCLTWRHACWKWTACTVPVTGSHPRVWCVYRSETILWTANKKAFTNPLFFPWPPVIIFWAWNDRILFKECEHGCATAQTSIMIAET